MKSYIVYDERARYDVDEAQVLVACSSVAEALSYLNKEFPQGVIVEYDVIKGNKMVNEVVRFDLSRRGER